jgi:hypothetical protein
LASVEFVPIVSGGIMYSVWTTAWRYDANNGQTVVSNL